MAARSVFKLFAKTYNCPFSSTYSSSTYPLPPSRDKIKAEKHLRSYSQPNRSPVRVERRKTESFTPQVRKVSRSLENLRDSRQKDEVVYVYQDERSDYNNFPVADMSVREPAREFKEKYIPEERTDEGNPIYELAEGSRNQDNFFNVIDFMTRIEREKTTRAFAHLQPSNIKPYGSTENLYLQNMYQRKLKIVYPVVNTTAQESFPRRRRVDNVHHKEYSSFRKSFTNEDLNRSDKTAKDLSKMNYSTACLTARKVTPAMQNKPPKLSVNSSFARKSSTSLLRKKKRDKFPVDDALELNRIGIMDQFYNKAKAFREVRAAMKSQENFVQSSRGNSPTALLKNTRTVEGRNFNTYAKSASAKASMTNKPSGSKKKSHCEMIEEEIKQESTSKKETKTKPADLICEEYVTVKLKDLQEECRRTKKCKPKICFGKLPKLAPPDCPCFEDYPLKEGKPLARLPKREVKQKPRVCPVIECGFGVPRADAGYKIEKKTLPQLIPSACPCEEREMVDFNIKRLPKVKVPEPPRICPPCEDTTCCIVERADDKLKIEKKTLPKLAANDCPCIEDPPMKNVALVRLKPKPMKPPVRCPPPPDVCPPRADENLKVKLKTLPVLEPGCVCVDPPPMDDVPPLQRLKKVQIKEPPRPVCEFKPCEEAIRADRCLRIEQKRLPAFVAQDCPCIEDYVPSEQVKLKRLVKRPVTVERKEICVIEECPARADDGMKIKAKKLPEIVPGDCPCIEPVMEDVEPLKRLVPKPVKEPPRVCEVEEPCPLRSDRCEKVEKKTLPPLPPGDCPCVEPEPPMDVPPLKKLKKRPVVFKRVCVVEEPCPPRADEDLKVKIKKLPPLKVPDCPCIEPPPPDDVKPLKRLKKVHIEEPPKICPVETCEDQPRADETDWLYWKRVEVKCEDIKTPTKTPKRNFSTSVQSRRFYGTKTKPDDDLFQLKYDVSNWRANKLMGKSYNIIIDIKPSVPLILTQTPIGISSSDQNRDGTALKRSKSEPLDCVTFIIYRSNSLVSTKSKSGLVKDSNDGPRNTISRFISTCSTFYEEAKDKEHQTPNCECPANDKHLQPRKPILTEDREVFIEPPFPSDDVIDESARKGRLYCNERKDSDGKEEEGEECQEEREEKALIDCEDERSRVDDAKKLTLWEKIVNYFKARDCPSPEEFRKMRLKEDAERAAAKAGLCLYDPKEMLNKNDSELPKVITAPKQERASK